MLIDDHEAQQRLEAAIDAAGGMRALARRIGVTPPVISGMRARNTRKTAITGKVASYLRLKRVSAYQLTENAKDPKQEHYEKERLAWNLLNGLPFEQSATMRVAGNGLPTKE